MASIRGILNIQSLNELTSENNEYARKYVRVYISFKILEFGVVLGPYKGTCVSGILYRSPYDIVSERYRERYSGDRVSLLSLCMKCRSMMCFNTVGREILT